MTVLVPSSIRVLMPNGQVAEMKVETYLAGVVAGEIGANAPLEALKAQAVAARTYAASAHRHPEQGADVCTARHCQEWKRVDPIVAPEVFQAVSETWGIVAIYNGKLIDAFFFEHCDGRTRSSEDVHIEPIPYLSGVECACGFVAMKGHGVGMCQRGAIVMARRGASFEQILQHYYRGIVVIHSGREPLQEASEAQPAKRAKKTKATTKRVKTAKVKPTQLVEPVLPVPAKDEEKKQAAPQEVLNAPAAEAVPTQQAPPIETAPIAENVAELPSAPVSVETPVTPVEPEPVVEMPALPVVIPEPVAEIRAVDAKPIIEQPPVAASQAPAGIETAAAEPIEEPIPVPAYVAQLNNPQAPVELPVDAKVPPISEHELPSLDEQVAVTKPKMHIDHLPGGRMIAGCLESAGVVITIEDQRKNKTLVFSGSAPHYGEGGFETIVGEDGQYWVSINGERLKVQVDGDTVFISSCGS